MYLFDTSKNIKINKTIASEVIGISRTHLSNILNGKCLCSKKTAFCIAKYLNENSEISDYFKKGE